MMLALVNRTTGQEPTPAELVAIERRAAKILRSPYSAPEQVAWAIDVANPDDVHDWFWQSCRKRAASLRAGGADD